MSENAGFEQRARLTKLLADLDLLFSISYFDREKDERTWSMAFDVGDGLSATVQIAFIEGFLSVFTALEVDEEIDPEVLRSLLYVNGSGPTGAFSVNGKAILASANIPTSHVDLELLKESIGGVLRLAREARRLLAEAKIGFRERMRN